MTLLWPLIVVSVLPNIHNGTFLRKKLTAVSCELLYVKKRHIYIYIHTHTHTHTCIHLSFHDAAMKFWKSTTGCVYF